MLTFTNFIPIALFLLGICILLNGYFVKESQFIYPKDADADLDTVQLIESRGLKAEVHFVKTEDSYTLTMHRIVCPNVTLGRPYLLVHGFGLSSRDWIINSPGIGTEYSDTYFNNMKVSNNLGFDLCLRGYDVWLANFRGNIYSINTRDVFTKGYSYWSFSHDEFCLYDLPAFINYILDKTKRSTLGYIGHSQGSRSIFCLLSEKPMFSDLVTPVVALAPTLRIGHMKSPVKYLAKPPIPEALRCICGPFFPGDSLFRKSSENFCRIVPLSYTVCSPFLFFLFGEDFPRMNQSRVHVYVSHIPAGSSTCVFAHFLQNYRSKTFSMFDYGVVENMRRYNSPVPPEHDIKKINSRSIILVSSHNDFFCDQKDVDWIRLNVELYRDIVVEDPKWNHMDFLYGLNSSKYVISEILNSILAFDSH